jgi:hypothetical protein
MAIVKNAVHASRFQQNTVQRYTPLIPLSPFYPLATMPIDFNKIKSIFIVEEPRTGSPEKPEAGPKSPATSSPAAPAPSLQQAAPGEISPKFMDVLFRAMENANLPGVDYLEYRQSLKSLEKMPMDEQVRYQSAFAMAQAMGATPPKLIESATHYMDVLKGEEAKFEQALRNQLQQQVGNREEAAKNLEAIVQQKAPRLPKKWSPPSPILSPPTRRLFLKYKWTWRT